MVECVGVDCYWLNVYRLIMLRFECVKTEIYAVDCYSEQSNRMRRTTIIHVVIVLPLRVVAAEL